LPDKKSRSFQDNLFSNIPACLFTITSKGKFIDFNKRFIQKTGFSTKVLSRKNFESIFKNVSAKVPGPIETARKKGTFCNEVFMISRKGLKTVSCLSLKKENPRKRNSNLIGALLTGDKKTSSRRELSSALKKYKGLFDDANDIIYTLDKKGRFLDISKKAREITGHKREDWIGKPYHPLLEKEFLKLASKTFAQSLKGYSGPPNRFQVSTKSGGKIWLEIKSSPLYSEDGKIIGEQSVARDITEIKKIEDDLIKSQSRYRSIYENTTDLIFFMDKEGKFTDCNERTEDVLGIKKKDFIGKRFTENIAPESIPLAYKNFQDGLKGKEVAPYVIKVYDGKKQIRTLEIRSSNVTERGKVVGRFAVATDITTKRKSDEMFEAIKGQQEAILSNIPDIAWLKDSESRFISVNEPFAKTLNLKPKDLVGKTDLDFYPQELAKMYRADDREVMRTGKRKKVDEPYEDARGKRIWIETVKTPIFNNKKQVIGSAGIARDITERLKTREEIQKLTQFQNSVIENANVWLNVLDSDGKVVIWNKAAEDISGFLRKDVVGHGKIWKWLYPDKKYRDRIFKTASDIISKGKIVGDFNTTIKTKSGEKKIITWYSRNLIDDKKLPIGSVALGYDITERMKAEEALRESEKKYRTLFERSAEGILVADTKTRNLLYANPTICKLLGYSESEITNLRIDDIHPKWALEHVKKEFLAQARGEKNIAPDIPFLRKNGKIIYTDVNAAGLTISGRVVNVGFISDITEKKKFEEEKIKLSRLAAIGTFSASIAHEIRNPLFSISTIAQLMEDEFKNSPNRELFGAMTSEISRLKDFINDMLFYAKPKRITKRTIYPQKVINGILFSNKGLLESKNLKTRLITRGSKNAKVRADTVQFRRLILNLFLNAIEASNHGGTITMKIDSSKGLKIDIHNSGKHIKKNDLPILFDLFYSTKPRGCGLGLPICKKIVEAHNGKIDVKSSKSQGTTFTVQF